MPRQRTSQAPRPKSFKPVVDVDDEMPDPIDPAIATAESMLKRALETSGLSLGGQSRVRSWWLRTPCRTGYPPDSGGRCHRVTRRRIARRTLLQPHTDVAS